MQKLDPTNEIIIRSGPSAAIIGALPSSVISEAWDITWDAQSKRIVALTASGERWVIRWYVGSSRQVTAISLPKELKVISRIVRRSNGLCLLVFRDKPRLQVLELCNEDNRKVVSIRQLNQSDYEGVLSDMLTVKRRQVLRNTGLRLFDLCEPTSEGGVTGSIDTDAFLDQYAVNSGQVGQPLVRFSKDNKAVLVTGNNTHLARFDSSWKKKDISTFIKHALSRFRWFRPFGAFCDNERALIGYLCQDKKNLVGRTLHCSMKSGNIRNIIDGLYVRSVDVYR